MAKDIKNEFKPWAQKSVLDEMKPDKKKDTLATAYDSWKGMPSEYNTSALLKELEPTLTGALRSYVGGDERLKPKAAIIALNAAKSYDPKQGVKLNTFVFNHLKGLNRVNAERTNVVHIPESVLLDKNKLFKREQQLEEDLGRPPSTEELADHTGLSAKRIEKLRQGTVFAPESQMLNEKGDTFFTNKADSQNVWVDYMYSDMDSVDKKIFEWSTGYKGSEKMMKKDIANRLGISAPAVSARINRIVSKLEKGYDIS
jgi:DNA-directed RNA polymerase specialized sigma subunit